MDDKKEESVASSPVLIILKEPEEAFYPQRKKHDGSSGTNLTCSGLEDRCNLQPKRWVKGLRPFDNSVVPTTSSGSEMTDVWSVNAERVWL